jgi:hypothetical protein
VTTDPAARLRAVSQEAFEVAKRYDAGDLSAASRVEALRKALDSLRSVVDESSGHEAEGLKAAWSEAWVDLNWVSSGGRLATSIRLKLHRAAPDSFKAP